MPIIYHLAREDNGSITLSIDLKDYLTVFRKMNKNQPLSPAERQTSQELARLFSGFEGSALFVDMIDAALAQFSPEEEAIIRQSPACELLADSGTEIIKNTIDSFLEQHLSNPSDSSSQLELNLQIESYEEVVSVIFSDNGQGFPEKILNKLSDESKQMTYMKRRQNSDKNSSRTDVKGLLGGGGFGLRHLIHQILIGRELTFKLPMIRPKNYASAIFFDNNLNGSLPGAAIQIVTQKQPLELENVSEDVFINEPKTTLNTQYETDYSGIDHLRLDDAFIKEPNTTRIRAQSTASTSSETSSNYASEKASSKLSSSPIAKHGFFSHSPLSSPQASQKPHKNHDDVPEFYLPTKKSKK